MALDLGTLIAHVEVETTPADRKLNAFERKLMGVARTQVPEILVGVGTAVAEGALSELEAQLRGLPDAEAFVDADTRQASARLADVAGEVRGLPDGTITVKARSDGFDELKADAAQGGREAGDDAGEGLSDGILTALVALPVAGTIVGIGAAIGSSLLDGLQNELREDTLVATTGLDPAAAQRIGRAAGEAYAANFGVSIEANFDTARAALQGGLLDPASTARDSQAVIESLSGVSDILGVDIPAVVRATTTLLRTGLVATADDAFDLLVKGQQNGANAADDLLDTFTEYPAVLQRLGLSGSDALGLVNQGLENGARNSDIVADALKEFQIRATDGSETSAAAFELLGLNAEDATARISAGGETARAGLDQVLDGLRAIEDPVARNAAAVGLFGTQAEDLGGALFGLDLDSVTADLGELEGAASGAISALGDNAAGSIESAQRNIEVAADGIKGALAEAFGPQIEDFARTVSSNREAVVTFLLDVANGGLDAGRALVNAAADGTEAFGDFVGTVGPQVLDMIAAILEGLDGIIGVDLGDARMEFDAFRTEAEDSFAAFDVGSETAADAIRTNLIENGIDPAQQRLNEVGFDLTTQARFTDSTTALAAAVGEIGLAADGTKASIELTSGAFDVTTESGRRLDEQIRAAVGALEAQVVAGEQAGRTTEELTADYQANRDALIVQLEAMGLTRDEAIRLADSYGAVPEFVVTTVSANGLQTAITQLDDLTTKLTRIDGDVVTYTVRQVNQETGRVSVSSVKARAGGGPVVQNEPYLVGEEGPELIVAPSDGFVIPAGPTAEILAGGFGSPSRLEAPAPMVSTRGGDTFDVKVYGQARPQETAAAMLTALRIKAHEVNR